MSAVGHCSNPFEALVQRENALRCEAASAGSSPQPVRTLAGPVYSGALPPPYEEVAQAVISLPVPEVTVDLSRKQIIVLVDTSKHMKKEDIKSGGIKFSRWEAVTQQIGRLSEELTKLDPDGIDLITIGKTAKVSRNMRTAADIRKVLDKETPHDYADITAAVKKAYELHEQYHENTPKESTVILILTAAEADSAHWFGNGEKELRKELVDISHRVKKPELGILFIQVGQNKDGAEMLGKLDELGLKNDIITRVAFEKLECQLNAYDLVAKALAGC